MGILHITTCPCWLAVLERTLHLYFAEIYFVEIRNDLTLVDKMHQPSSENNFTLEKNLLRFVLFRHRVVPMSSPGMTT